MWDDNSASAACLCLRSRSWSQRHLWSARVTSVTERGFPEVLQLGAQDLFTFTLWED